MVWELIEGSKEGIGGYELLNGCVDDWKWQGDGANGGDITEVMGKTNIAIAARIAGIYPPLLVRCEANGLFPFL